MNYIFDNKMTLLTNAAKELKISHVISSFEINHLPLIDIASKTGKPIIISTGIASNKNISSIVLNKNRVKKVNNPHFQPLLEGTPL